MNTKDEELINIAKARGGYYLGLSNSVNHPPKYLWKCEKGHIWEAYAYSIKRGSWCFICAKNKQKNTIEDMRELARLQNGECLSTAYINYHTRLTWKCSKGHIFETTPTQVKKGRWCRECGEKRAGLSRRTSMEEIYAIASKYNGKCLSENYNPPEKLKWECELGHIWDAGLDSVKAGHWCPFCGWMKRDRKPVSLEEMRKLAANHGGKCLSEFYVNTDSKLKWMCEKGHIWEAIPSAIKKGHWCPICAGQEKPKLEQLQKIAYDRGGKYLSKHYQDNHTKLEWQCAEGHIFFANYSNISLGQWCPECSAGVGERICRVFFEQIFSKTFPKSRPPWLTNQDGNQMELDGYCVELALAFEHQGRQHHKQHDYFYSSENQFIKRQSDDKRKKSLCAENNIVLIEVPEIPYELSILKVQTFILDNCQANGVPIPENAENKKVDISAAYNPTAKEKMRLIIEAASVHGGICLSEKYSGNHVKLRFVCQNNHKWETTPIVVLKGHWCPKCRDIQQGIKRRLTITEMNQLALKHDGRCLSTEYINANEHLLWECSEGHQWKAIPNSIKRGSWCPICAKERFMKS
jgi:hypothetical protein